MKYNFDEIIDRTNTNSEKWNVKEGELPMWVADMEFQSAPAIREAIIKRATHGIYGYNVVPDSWYQAIQNWWKRRHQLEIEKDSLIFCTGVIPAVTCAVQRMTNVGDNVLIQTPVYDTFFHSVENFGRHVLENKLTYDGDVYNMDFKDLEEKLANPLTTMMILCNPQNPAGKVWKKEELEKVGELCKKYDVVVVSDEIHCDITEIGTEYVPFASVSETCRMNSITCISATKTFNIAGLQSAAVMIPSERLRSIMKRGLNSNEVAEPNTFAIDAVVAAFNESEEWLEELRDYLSQNKKFAVEYLKENIPELKLISSNATYLLWIDCSAITNHSTELCKFIRSETGLYVTAGAQYRGNGDKFMRVNIACPKKQLEDGMERLKNGVKRYVER